MAQNASIKVTSGGASAIDDWATSTGYEEDQEVLHLGLRFRCLTNHTSDATSFFEDLDQWDCVSSNGFILNQATHGFSALDVIYESSGTWAAAQANVGTTLSDPPTVVVGVDTAGNYFLAAQDGVVTFTSHGLTDDNVYFLSDAVAGDLVITSPSTVGNYVCPIVRVLDTNTLNILPYRPNEVLAVVSSHWTRAGGYLSPAVANDSIDIQSTTLDASISTAGIGLSSTDNDIVVSADSSVLGTDVETAIKAEQTNVTSGDATVSIEASASGGTGSITFRDDGQYGSTWTQTHMTFSDSANEWDIFKTNFGEVSVVNAICQAMMTGANTDVDTGTEDVDTFNPNEDGAVIWHYSVQNGANHRGGTVTACWDDSAGTVAYTETSTPDIGDTSPLTLSVDMSAALGNVRLRATATSDNWIVRVVRIRIQATGSLE